MATLRQQGTGEVEVKVIQWRLPKWGRWEARYVETRSLGVLDLGSGYLTLGGETYHVWIDPGWSQAGDIVGGPGEPVPPEANGSD